MAVASVLSFLALLAIWVSQSPVLQAGARPSAVEAQTATWQVVGQIGGPTQAVAIQGNYAYVGVGLRLVVLDVSNPASLREVGTTRPFPHFVEGVVVSGTLAYVAAGGSGLRVVDVSNPASPLEIGAWDSPGYAQGLALSGTTIYLADGPYGLRVVDVSNPARPTEVGSAYPMNYAFDVALAGRYAYVAGAGAGLLVADVSDPARPVELGSLDTPGYAYGVATAGSSVYLADGWEGLRVMDVADPASPREVGSFDTSGWAFDIVVKDAAAYVADGWGGILVLNVTDPANPAQVGSYQPAGGHAADIAVSGGTLYVADRNNGLRMLDLSAPSLPAQVGFYRPMGFADDVAVAGTYAYVAAGPYGLRVVDISDPTRPRELGTLATPGYAWSVVVEGSYAYVGSIATDVDPGGLLVADISDPRNPAQAAYFRPEHDRPRNIVIKQGILYGADEWGLQLIDISNPVSPTQLSFIQLAGPTGQPDTTGVTVSGTVAYVAQSQDGLKLVDVSNPRNPVLLGVYRSPDLLKAMSVAVVGDLAYVGDNNRVHTVDVSNTRDPKGVGFYSVAGVIDAMTPLGDKLYLASGSPGLQVLDISSPRSPALVGSVYVPGYTAGMAVSGSYAFLAAEDGGLFILERAAGSGVVAGQWEKTPAHLKLQGETASRRTVSADPHRGLQDSSFSTLPPIGDSGRRSAGRPAQGPNEALEGRSPLNRAVPVASGTSLTVTSTADNGAGTLRWAIETASSGDTITFNPAVFPPGSPATIALTSSLPVLSRGNVTIDGSNAGVVLDGRGTPTGTIGLNIYSDGNVIKGLQIVNFPQDGVVIGNGLYNVIGGDRSRGAAPLGEGNLISGNRYSGVVLVGTTVASNTIAGNYIGTDVAGTGAMGNGHDGISVGTGASQNRIGGITPGEGNLISGNGYAGVDLNGASAVGNRIIGNLIGTDSTGTRAIGNTMNGVFVVNGASQNVIGGTSEGERNVISGNGRVEVGLMSRANANRVVGNYLGTNAQGLANIGTAFAGVSMELGAYDNVIQANVIANDGTSGVMISDWGTSGNEVIGNLIGVDATGAASLGGSGDGIHVNASFNKIGGTNASERNVISGNGGNGIKVGFHSMRDAVIIGNYIGTDSSGSRAMGNGSRRSWSAGIALTESAYHSFIGGATREEGNVISGNSGDGIGLSGVGVRHNVIGGNYIGTDANGGALGNQGSGISVANAEHNSLQTNAIAYNGTGIQAGESPYNSVRRNSIHSNTGKGIVASALAAPVITAAVNSGVSGTACPGCTVEVFSDTEDEGRVYEGSVVAGPTGAFTFDKGTPLAGPNVTATATDGGGNTSGFSAAQKVSWRIYLPAVFKQW